MAAIARGEFLEHAEVHGALYGTRRDAVEALRAEGRVAVLDIDVQGARQVGAEAGGEGAER
jgi:guanylate kinase